MIESTKELEDTFLELQLTKTSQKTRWFKVSPQLFVELGGNSSFPFTNASVDYMHVPKYGIYVYKVRTE